MEMQAKDYIRFMELVLVIMAGCSVEKSIPFAIFGLVIAFMFCMMDFLISLIQKQIKMERQIKELKRIIAEYEEEICSGNYRPQ